MRFAPVMSSAAPSDNFPDGIDHGHVPNRGWFSYRASWLSIIVLGTLMAFAASGLLGGTKRPLRVAESTDVRLAVRMPQIIRNGEFFETEIVILPKRAFTDLTLGIEPGLWHDLTVNTFIPAATAEKFQDGAFRFSFGPAEAGQPIVIKIDAQINPSTTGGTRGIVSVEDGETNAVRLPIAMRVLP